LCHATPAATIRGMGTDHKPTERQQATERQAKSRQGVARRLERIEHHLAIELVDIREQLAALCSVLAVELQRRPTQGRHR
jgi:hypothetical protein